MMVTNKNNSSTENLLANLTRFKTDVKVFRFQYKSSQDIFLGMLDLIKRQNFIEFYEVKNPGEVKLKLIRLVPIYVIVPPVRKMNLEFETFRFETRYDENFVLLLTEFRDFCTNNYFSFGYSLLHFEDKLLFETAMFKKKIKVLHV